MGANTRWTYKVVDVKPSFLGFKAENIQETLNQLGTQGWELVNILNIGMVIRLFLKKEN
jgi:hypothetical protein